MIIFMFLYFVVICAIKAPHPKYPAIRIEFCLEISLGTFVCWGKSMKLEGLLPGNRIYKREFWRAS